MDKKGWLSGRTTEGNEIETSDEVSPHNSSADNAGTGFFHLHVKLFYKAFPFK